MVRIGTCHFCNFIDALRYYQSQEVGNGIEHKITSADIHAMIDNGSINIGPPSDVDGTLSIDNGGRYWINSFL